MNVAKAHAGVNVNALTDDQAYDEASGAAILVGTPVSVEAVNWAFSKASFIAKSAKNQTKKRLDGGAEGI